MKTEIVIFDFGSQYTQLLSTKVRQLGYYNEIVPSETTYQKLKTQYPHLKAIILSGGPSSVYDQDAYQLDPLIWSSEYAILGICYGMQLMIHQNGGTITRGNSSEYGRANLTIKNNNNSILDQISQNTQVWMSHTDQVINLGNKFIALAYSGDIIVVVAHIDRPHWGVQFHVEVEQSTEGLKILQNFCQKIARLTNNWNLTNWTDQTIAEIKNRVGNKQVLLALSGGVDSSVTAVLIHRAIGQQLHCVFVDNGLLRLNETQEVITSYRQLLGLNLHVINAQELFYQKLKGITDPETKRKIIGQTFIEVFEQYQLSHPEISFLAQGTIYPDVIESAAASNKQKVIKSHHNVGGLPNKLKWPLLEPLRFLFKNEVRKVGMSLSLDSTIIKRHPFPGPGFGVRIVGEVTAEKCEILKKADAIFIKELINHQLYDQVSQAAVILLPIKAVGVVGDNRSHGYACVLRAVKTNDFMTAEVSQLTHHLLNGVATKIINQVPEISRVLYDLTTKPPGTIEWE